MRGVRVLIRVTSAGHGDIEDILAELAKKVNGRRAEADPLALTDR